MRISTRGFTIVELLIVIVVVAILAAISIVAYNGVQSRSRDGARDSAVSNLKKALELYNTQNGAYPIPSGCINAGCLVTSLSSYLVPGTINTLPNDPGAPSKNIYYVTDANGAGYGLRIPYYETKPICRYISPTGNTGWWSDPFC